MTPPHGNNSHNTKAPSSSSSLPDHLTSNALLVPIASYLTPRDLLSLQCVSKHCHDTLRTRHNDALLWRNLCAWRWAPWPRYRLTPEREQEINTIQMTRMEAATAEAAEAVAAEQRTTIIDKEPTSSSANTTTTTSMTNNYDNRGCSSPWQRAFLETEREATRTTLRVEDLINLQWYLSYVLSGIRGEGRSEHVRICFTVDGYLLVPNYPPMPYEIVNFDNDQRQQQEPQPQEARHLIRPSLRGDDSLFSESQWLRVLDFPIHYIARQKSTAEWLIVNPHVIMVSSGWR